MDHFSGSLSTGKDRCRRFKGFGRWNWAEMFTRYKQRFPTTQVTSFWSWHLMFSKAYNLRPVALLRISIDWFLTKQDSQKNFKKVNINLYATFFDCILKKFFWSRCTWKQRRRVLHLEKTSLKKWIWTKIAFQKIYLNNEFVSQNYRIKEHQLSM